MDTLHQNVSWFAVLFAMIAISSGFIESGAHKSSWLEKNEATRRPVVQLAKSYRPLYNSIFTGA